LPGITWRRRAGLKQEKLVALAEFVRRWQLKPVAFEPLGRTRTKQRDTAKCIGAIGQDHIIRNDMSTELGDECLPGSCPTQKEETFLLQSQDGTISMDTSPVIKPQSVAELSNFRGKAIAKLAVKEIGGIFIRYFNQSPDGSRKMEHVCTHTRNHFSKSSVGNRKDPLTQCPKSLVPSGNLRRLNVLAGVMSPALPGGTDP